MSTERMMKARAGLLALHPFFGILSFKLELVEDPKCKSTWTDGKTLGFNPEWVEATPMPELEAAFAHQVFTCAMGHHLRRGSRKPELWNDASDHVINAELKRSGLALPPGSLADPQYEGRHVEAVYAALEQQPQPGDQGNQGQGTGGQDQGGGTSQGAPGEQPGQGKGGNPTQDPGAHQGQPGGAGEGATGRVDDYPGDQPGQGADEATLAQEQAEWQAAVAQAAQAARAAGKLPGAVERMVEQFLNPRVDWREALARFFAARSKEDYNWSKPSPHWMQAGFYMPSLDSQKIGKVAVAIDMSGSIDQETINQFCGELSDIRDTVRPEEIIIMGFDTRVRGGVVRISADDPVKFARLSGGGTAFDDPPRVLEEMDVKPEVLVYLTDLDSTVFPQEPDYPVLWCTTRKTKAPFGEVIEMY